MKVVIWGYKPDNHTHGNINYGFYRAFKHLGYETYWFDDNDDVDLDFSDSIFLCEGNSSKNMPQRKDCKYICHNCSPMDVGKRINIQYYTKEYKNELEISHGIKLIGGDCVMFVWGSSLLPHEFDELLLTNKRDKINYYLGTVDNSEIKGGNYKYINEFAKVSKDYTMKYGGGYSVEMNNPFLKFIPGWITEEQQKEYLTTGQWMPALQGNRQLKNGMIPCRIFKAISYGMDGLTNNDFAHEFFNYQTIFSNNMEELYHEAENRKDDIERKRYLFNFVKENHTYINNVKAIMQVL